MSTINWPAGTMPAQTLSSGNTYSGAGPGKTIIRNPSTDGASAPHSVSANGAQDVTLENCTLDINGLKADRVKNFTLRNVEITNIHRVGTDYQGINAWGVDGFLMDHVVCRNVGWGTIFNGPSKNVTARDCMFESCNIMFKAMIDPGGGNFLMERLLFKWATSGYYGIEIQPNSKSVFTIPNIVAKDCCYIQPDLKAGASSQNTGGISMPGEKNTGWAIQGFYYDGTTRGGLVPGKNLMLGSALIMELAGNGCVVENCDIRNGNDPLSINVAAVSPIIKSLRYNNCREVPDWTGKPGHGTSPFPNNGPNQIVNCGGAALAGGIVIDPPPIVIPPPVVTAPKIVDVTVRFDDGSTVITHP